MEFSWDLCRSFLAVLRQGSLSAAARDLNLIFPLQRLLELEAEGIVGSVGETHYGFGFTDNPHELLLPGHEIGTMLAEANVDLVLLVPA